MSSPSVVAKRLVKLDQQEVHFPDEACRLAGTRICYAIQQLPRRHGRVATRPHRLGIMGKHAYPLKSLRKVKL